MDSPPIMSEDSSPHLPLAEVGRFERLSEARERGLVVSAMELPHWVERDGSAFVLSVEMHSSAVVLQELEKYEAERRERAAALPADRPVEKIETMSLFVAGWIMSAFWAAQNYLPPWWSDAGEAVSGRIVNGEWWRTLTALTLHGDVAHLVVNIATGVLFAAFVIPQLGSGLTWLAIIASGAVGNYVNAWFYHGQPHISIGASTAVFGALGLLVAGEFIDRLRSAHTRSRWQLILPLGAGLALLAFLGAGDEHKRTDYMAHLWGFAAGLCIGGCACALDAKARASRTVQRIAAMAGPILLALAWRLALHESA